MGLFKFGQKKETTPCACGGNCGDKTARILVLGACCKRSADSFANVQQAVKELGITQPVANLGDAADIAAYGVMQPPALVVDGKVLLYGRLITVETAKKLITEAGVQP